MKKNKKKIILIFILKLTLDYKTGYVHNFWGNTSEERFYNGRLENVVTEVHLTISY